MGAAPDAAAIFVQMASLHHLHGLSLDIPNESDCAIHMWHEYLWSPNPMDLAPVNVQHREWRKKPLQPQDLSIDRFICCVILIPVPPEDAPPV